MRPFRRDLVLSLLFYSLLAIMMTWPVAVQLTTGVAGDPNRDNLQFVWNLWWVQEALVNQQVSPAHVTMLHWPAGGENQLLALSVLIPLLALPTTLLGGPVLSYNLWFLLSFPLAALGGWLLSCYVTGNRRAALIGGLIFGFFPHKSMHATGHFLQIMLFLFPLLAIGLLRLLRRPSWRQAMVTGLTLGLCLLVNLVHIGFFLLPMSALLVLSHLWQDRQWWRSRGPLWLAPMLLVAFLVTLPIVPPFLAKSITGQLEHYQAPGTVSFSADLLSFVTPSPHHPLLQTEAFLQWSHFLLEGNLEENVAYMGLTVLALAAWGGWRQRRTAAPWLLIAVVMAVLALGPFLKVGGTIMAEGSGPEIDGVRSPLLMPYAALMQLPFYKWGRIPNRQIMLTMLALSVLAGLGVASLRGKRRAWLVTALATLLIILEYLLIFPYPTGSTLLANQPVWQELRQEARGAVLDLPQWDFFSFPPSNESLFAQTVHRQPIVGGYIHRMPPGSAETAKAIQELVVPPASKDIVPRPTGNEALLALRSLDIATVVLHRDARSSSIWDDEDDAAAYERLTEWAGTARWANERFAVYDLPDMRAENPPQLWTLDPQWHVVEGLPDEARRWMPEQAELWLWYPAPPGEAASEQRRLTLDAQSFNGPRTLIISLNGAEVWRGVINERTLIETPPVKPVQSFFNRISFSLLEGCQRPTDLDPEAGDGRCLGLLVYHVSLVP